MKNHRWEHRPKIGALSASKAGSRGTVTNRVNPQTSVILRKPSLGTVQSRNCSVEQSGVVTVQWNSDGSRISTVLDPPAVARGHVGDHRAG